MVVDTLLAKNSLVVNRSYGMVNKVRDGVILECVSVGYITQQEMIGDGKDDHARDKIGLIQNIIHADKMLLELCLYADIEQFKGGSHFQDSEERFIATVTVMPNFRIALYEVYLLHSFHKDHTTCKEICVP